MASADVLAFLQTLHKSNLLAAEQMAAIRAEVSDEQSSGSDGSGAPAWTAGELADELVARGVLTRWQANLLLQGRRAFFLGRYKLLDRIGAGGMGAVFKAQHATMGRIVAIKIMAAALVKSPSALARFRQEIQAAAALNHPNIVTAYDAGQVGDTHFLVMEYAEGHDLGTFISTGELPPVSWTCECMRQAALGLQHAFDKGMVHRDIKPTNLLVTRDAEAPRPLVKILDMGLARYVSELRDDGLTQTGQVLGTPDYISPEQAADTKRADIRSDIFSLGCTFFRLLTGKLPFKGDTVMEKLMARAMDDAPPVRSLRPDVPPGVEAVLTCMLQRDLRRRYQTPGEVAQALAPFALNGSGMPLVPPAASALGGAAAAPVPAGRLADAGPPDELLERFLQHLATRAAEDKSPGVDGGSSRAPGETGGSSARRPQGDRDAGSQASSATPRPARRRRMAALAAVLIPIMVAGWYLWFHQPHSTVVIDWPVHEREGGRLELDGRPVVIPVAARIVLSVPAGEHLIRLIRADHPPFEKHVKLQHGQAAHLRSDWESLRSETRRREVEHLAARIDRIGSLTDESLLAGLRSELVRSACEWAGTDESRAVAELFPRMQWPLDGLSRDQISNDDLELAGLGDRRRAPASVVAILGDGRLKHWHEVDAVAMGAQGRQLASAGRDERINVWDAATGRLQHTLLRAEARSLLFIPRSEWLVTESLAGWEVWQGTTGQHVRQLTEAAAPLACDPTGHWIAAQGRRGAVLLWDTRSNFEREVLEAAESSPVRQLSFSGNGSQLAVARVNNTVRVWDVEGRKESRSLSGASHPLFDAEGRWLSVAIAGDDVQIWDARTWTLLHLLEEAGQPLSSSPDGRLLITIRHGRLVIWDVAQGHELRTLTDVVGRIAVSPNHHHVAVGDEHFGGLRIGNLNTGEWKTATGHVGAIHALAFSPDSQTLVSAGADHTVRFWSSATGMERPLTGVGIETADVSPDGRILALATQDGSIKLWDVVTRKTSRTFDIRARSISTLRFSPNGRHLAAIGDWGFFTVTVRLWDVARGQELSFLGDQPASIRAISFSPDARWLATAGDDRTVEVWDLETMKRLKEQEDLPDRVQGLAFGPHGDWIALACRNQPPLIWHWRTAEAPRPVPRAENADSVACARHHPWLAFARDQGPLAVWSLPDRQEIARLPAASGGITDLDLAAPRPELAGATGGGRVFLRDLSTADQTQPRQIVLGPEKGRIESVRFSSEGRHLLTVNGNGTSYVIRVRGFEQAPGSALRESQNE